MRPGCRDELWAATAGRAAAGRDIGQQHTFRERRSAEGVGYDDPLDLPTMGHVLGVKLAASEGTGAAMIALSQYEKP